VCDALLKLQVVGAGYLPDITPISPSTPHPPTRTVAPASTVLLVPKSSPSFPSPSPLTSLLDQTLSLSLPTIPQGTPYADLTNAGSIVVISQPGGQKCAVLGGIMAARMRKLGAAGALVDGRVRDLGVLGSLGMPVWSKATSSIGMAAEAKAWATDVTVHIGGVDVSPGDLIMLDPEENAAVAIPAGRLDEVLELIPKLVAADEKVMKDVEEGVEVKEAFARHRS
ncbi:DlpA domain-containing protein, partial [Eremomyces bilateralis CBS 781.70]